MPRRLISDAHEWINEIRTVPDHYSAKLQRRERTSQSLRGKKTLLSLTLVTIAERFSGCSIGGRATDLEIPPPETLFRSPSCLSSAVKSVLHELTGPLVGPEIVSGKLVMGSSAGAAHF